MATTSAAATRVSPHCHRRRGVSRRPHPCERRRCRSGRRRHTRTAARCSRWCRRRAGRYRPPRVPVRRLPLSCRPRPHVCMGAVGAANSNTTLVGALCVQARHGAAGRASYGVRHTGAGARAPPPARTNIWCGTCVASRHTVVLAPRAMSGWAGVVREARTVEENLQPPVEVRHRGGVVEGSWATTTGGSQSAAAPPPAGPAGESSSRPGDARSSVLDYLQAACVIWIDFL